MILKKTLFVLLTIAIASSPVWAEDRAPETAQTNRTVTGTVADEAGEPVIGASIVEKGTTNGTVTDMAGHFSLKAADNALLQISFIGYVTQEISVQTSSVNGRPLLITLIENVKALDEVVVIGYGVAKKSDLTGAVVRADLTVMQNSPKVNALSGLKGIVPGLNVGVTTAAGDVPSISIRGRNSISGSTSPLIVVDGIIYRGSMNDINPADIESVDILKDASSAAIYGSQASNGVMLITTRTAKNMSKPVIEYSGTFSYQTPIRNLEMRDRDGYIQLVTDANMSKSRIGADLHPNPDYDVSADFRTKETIDGYLAGTNTNWLDLMSVDVPYIQNHNLSLRGRNELASYYLSFGAVDQQNMIKNDAYKRYNLRANIDAKVTDWFKVGTQSFFVLGDWSGNNVSFYDVMQASPLTASHDADGKQITVYPGGGVVSPLAYFDMPNVDKQYKMIGNFYGEVQLPLKGLSYRINYSHNLSFVKINTFNPYSNGLLGQAKKTNTNSEGWTLDNILSYGNKFGLHEVNATLVYGVEEREEEYTNATANNFTDQTLGFNRLNVAQSDLNVLESGAWKETSLYMMGRLNYIFNSRYLATATVRRDGFSGFGARHKIGVFPSASLAWRLSEEDFLKEKAGNLIDNLKIRASYGVNGNRTSRYATMASMSYGDGYVYGENGTPEMKQSINAMSNEDLRWETTAALNLGMDFSLLKGRLSGYYEYYNSRTTNLIYNVNIPNMNGSGSTSIATNIGKMRNYGHELSITGIPIQTKDLEWTSTFNFSLNRNKVVSVLGLDADGDGREDDLVSAGIFIGQPLNVVYNYNIIGMWQIDDYNQGIIPQGSTYGTYKVEDINEDGKYTAADDRKILGYTDPSYRFSWHNRLRYKDFELNAFINSVQGGSDYYYGNTATFGVNYGISYNFFKDFDYWTPENPNAKYRQPYAWNEALGSGFHPYQQRSFIRLQELSLAWYLPQSLLKKAAVSHAKLFVSGTNLLTITSWDGWDPEANQGLSYAIGGYPTMKNYTIGLSFEF
jgi:TonB-linked SusC/RagA family outer membrane protein